MFYLLSDLLLLERLILRVKQHMVVVVNGQYGFVGKVSCALT